MLRDRAHRASFTGVTIASNPMGSLSPVRRLISTAIPTPENRWTGTNRGGYANPAWDELGRSMATKGTAHTGQIMHTWNVHEWDIQPRS